MLLHKYKTERLAESLIALASSTNWKAAMNSKTADPSWKTSLRGVLAEIGAILDNRASADLREYAAVVSELISAKKHIDQLLSKFSPQDSFN